MLNKSYMFLLFVALVASQTLNPSRQALNNNDINAMRYAVTLENLEANFYNTMQTRFNANAFATANLPGVTAGTFAVFTQIQAHENAHVRFLNQALTDLGITPPAVCTYKFDAITTVQQYIRTAALFEAVGVSAYDGAINTIFNSTVVQALATIATIEARHAGYLAALNNSMPISQASFDTANAPATVAGQIAPFLTCPYDISAFLPARLTVVPVPGPIPADPSSAVVGQNDINAMNYALFLELLEEAFYIYGQGRFSSNDFALAGYDSSVYINLGLIQAHETAHVNTLTSTINQFRGTPVARCVYNFATLVTDVKSYLATAAVLEGTGVSAYDGAVNTIYNGDVKQVAATIATIEARHSAYLNNITNTNNGYILAAAYDTATLPTDIVTAVTRLNVITSCPNNYQASLPLPRVYTLNAYQNNVTSSSTSTGSGSGTSTTSSSSSVHSVFSFAVFLIIMVALF